MDTKQQPSSGIDYFHFFDNERTKETFFHVWSNYFWNVARETSEDSSTRQKIFRLQWLGDWLTATHGWKELNPGITPFKAIQSYLILRYNLSASQVANMTPDEMSLILVQEWEAFKASEGAKDFLSKIGKHLDYLDEPFRGRH
ncbi:MAG TPA: hypothetical protein VGL07_15790 [Buttiauxella sp.]